MKVFSTIQRVHFGVDLSMKVSMQPSSVFNNAIKYSFIKISLAENILYSETGALSAVRPGQCRCGAQ